jgi:hypothetical protein
VTTAISPRTVGRTVRRLAQRREWTPHFWIGCDAFAWWRLLVRNHFSVHWSKWYVAAVAAVVSGIHTALRLVQTAIYGRRVARTRIQNAPVFIIGHWRSGTTLLHELLIRDPRHAFPTTYECLVPHHFLISRSWAPKVLWWLMPSRRPMDNMAAGWDRPQEDEFALCLMGQPSPYQRIAFPNRPLANGSGDLRQLTPRAQKRWKATFLRFMRELTLVNAGRRLILKSPPHTCRVETLLEMFPDARFIHVVRNPYAVFPSTVNLWESLYRYHGLQRPTFEGLEESVLDTYVTMFDRVEDGKKLLAPDRFYEIRYEDLLRDPAGQLRQMYQRLDLGEFEPARKPVETYLAGVRNYETNQYDLSSAERAGVDDRWGRVSRMYGYTGPAE